MADMASCSDDCASVEGMRTKGGAFRNLDPPEPKSENKASVKKHIKVSNIKIKYLPLFSLPQWWQVLLFTLSNVVFNMLLYRP